MTKFFVKFKKPYFWPICPIFLAKTFFPKNLAVTHNFARVSSTMPEIQRNLFIYFQKNIRTGNRTEERTYPILQDPPGYRQGSNTYSCNRLAFKSQRYRVQCPSNQNLQHHSQHVKKINSFYKLILTIQQILEFHKLNSLAYF